VLAWFESSGLAACVDRTRPHPLATVAARVDDSRSTAPRAVDRIRFGHSRAMSSLHVPSVPGQNGPGSDAGSNQNSPGLHATAHGMHPSAMQLTNEEKESRAQDHQVSGDEQSRRQKRDNRAG
jgi:hypothetical protein